MKIDLQDVSDTRKTLAVTLEASEIAAEEKTLLSQFSNQAKIPGFRPGKAPIAMVRKRFAKEVAQELKQRIISKAYQNGTKEASVDLINVVDLKESDITSDADATLTFTLDIRPDFDVSNYKGLELTGLSVDVTDAAIDEAIENVRKERAEFEPVEREAGKGDYVKFSHEGSIDGQAISEIVADKPVYAKMPQTWEEVGTEQGLIPGLSNQLEGLKTGDKKDIEVEFPADFNVEGLQGKKAVYSVEVQEVRERKLPEMDEAFFKAQQVKDLDELKERVSTFLKGQKEQERRANLRDQVCEKLTADQNFSLPESLVEQQTDQTMREIVMDNARRGISQEQLEQNKDEIHSNAKATSAQRVKIQLILSQIAQKEELKVEDQDMSQFIMNRAYQSGKKPEEIVKEIKKDRNQIVQIQESILNDKTLEFLINEAKVSDNQD